MSKSVLIVGAGVLGLTTAFFLSKSGLETVVVEANSSEALETSFRNGGQLSFSHAEPLHLTKTSIKNSFRGISPVKLPLFDWNFTKYLLRIKNGFSSQDLEFLIKMSVAGIDSFNEILDEIRPNHAKIDFKQNGLIHFYTNSQSFDNFASLSGLYNQKGLANKLLNKSELLDLEPSLFYVKNLVGGVFFPKDAQMNCYLFCKSLRQYLEQNGVKFIFNTPVKRLVCENNKISYALTEDNAKLQADSYVLATALPTLKILKNSQIKAPEIFGIRGYSMNIDTRYSNFVPEFPLIDIENKIVLSPQNGNKSLRIAGLADFCLNNKHSKSFIIKRQDVLLKKVLDYYPTLKTSDISEKWTGVRVMSANFRPIVDRWNMDNLYLNTGHGRQGFTLSAVSGKIIASKILKYDLF